MGGVQFLTDHQGQKTAAIVDLKEHREFWAEVLSELGEPTDIQFLINSVGKKIAVVLDFEKHGELWEDVYDGIIADERENEPTIPWKEVKQSLK